jgi:hypothetical protein
MSNLKKNEAADAKSGGNEESHALVPMDYEGETVRSANGGGASAATGSTAYNPNPSYGAASYFGTGAGGTSTYYGKAAWDLPFQPYVSLIPNASRCVSTFFLLC